MRTAAKRDRMTRSAGVIVQNGDGRGHRWARLLEVWSLRDRLSDRILLPDLAEELGVRYHELYRTSRQLGLELKRHPTNRQFEVPLEAARHLRVEHARVRALHERSMKLAVAARQLNLAVSTVCMMAKRGELDVDPETDSSGARFVTAPLLRSVGSRVSEIRQLGSSIKKSCRSPTSPDSPAAPGSSYSTLHAPVLEEVPGRGKCELTAESLPIHGRQAPDIHPGTFSVHSSRRLVRISGGNTWMCQGVYGFHAYRAIDLEPPLPESERTEGFGGLRHR